MKKGSKLPKKEVVHFILKQVFKKHREIESQKELAEFVNQELKKVDQVYTISGKRLRMLCVGTDDIELKIHTKIGKKQDKCPSCGHGLRKIHTKNLRGKKILFKLKCPKCSYSGVNGKWVPSRYRFLVRT